jgi:hypothetical protein
MLGGTFSIHHKKQKSIALGNYTLKTTIGKGHSAVVKVSFFFEFFNFELYNLKVCLFLS